jgi:hypothetical protein
LATHHEATAAPDSYIAQLEQNREAILAETVRRWEQRDPTPLIPPFKSPIKPPQGEISPKGKSKR